MRAFTLSLMVAFFLACGAPALVRETRGQAGESVPGLTEEVLSARIAQLEALVKAGNSAPETAIPVYQEALLALREGKAAASVTADYRRQMDAMPAALQAVEAEMARAGEWWTPPAEVEQMDLDQLVAKYEELKAELGVASGEGARLVGEQTHRIERTGQLAELLSKAKNDLAALAQAPVTPDAVTELDQARIALAAARRVSLEQQIGLLNLERSFYQTTGELLDAQISLNARKVAAGEEVLIAWRILVDRRRGSTAQQQLELARELNKKFLNTDGLKELAAQMLEFAEDRSGTNGLAGNIVESSHRLADRTAQLAMSRENHLASRRRVSLLEKSGLSIDTATGALMRAQRNALKPQRELHNQLREAVQESAETQIAQQELERKRRLEPEVETQLGRIISARPELAELENEVRSLLKTRMALFDGLIKDYRSYNATLSELTEVYRDLSAETAVYSRYIDERLLWIRSSAPLSLEDFPREGAAVAALLGKRSLGAWLADMRRDMQASPFVWLLSLSALSVLLLRRRFFKKRLMDAGRKVRRRSCTSYAPTAQTLLVTVLLALPLPALLWFLYWRTADAPPEIASALLNVAVFLSSMSALWVVTRSDGLLVEHFGVEHKPISVLHRHLRWFIVVFAGLLFFTSSLPVMPLDASLPVANANDSLSVANREWTGGRLFFIAGMITVAVFASRVLRPSLHLIRWKGKTESRMAKFWHFCGVAVPLALALGAALGFFSSVRELRVQIVGSLALILLTVFVVALVHRWILLGKRKLAVQGAARLRSEQLTLKNAEGSVADGAGSLQAKAQPDMEEAAAKVVQVGEQTNRLVRATAYTAILIGLWGIWSQTIPALSVFDRVTLWSDSGVPATSAGSSASVSDADGGNAVTDGLGSLVGAADSKYSDDRDSQGAAATGAKSWITLEDLIKAIAVLVLTLVAARDIPGLLELTIFRRMNLGTGTAFAYTTSIRYLILVIGIVCSFGLIAITWSKVQWIAAAITLGIGFGLQEVFANFVAGLIILFERPIRLGDFVTIGDVSGQVTQIRMRATTIRDWGNKELVVPNKQFITEKLLNWTLSDSVIRLEIPVGIAYGSDTRKARGILEKIARDEDMVLEVPVPRAVFLGFGNSSLDFELRAFVRSVQDHIEVRSRLHFAIDDSFREANIEIAFPQSDIHIRSLPESAAEGVADALSPEVAAQVEPS